MVRLRDCLLVMILGIVACLTALPVGAQEPPRADEKSDRSIREQDIYIPYEKLRQVFEKHGRGVFLPYEKFQELWRAAQEKTRPATEPKPPVGALITEIENEATVEKEVVRVKAKLQIEVLGEGWNEIPLRLADAAITAASVAGKPARIIGATGQGYRLLIEKKGKPPEQIELKLEFAKAIVRTPGQNSVSFQAPQAPVSRWRVRIPQAGVKVNLQPLIAATEAPPDKPAEGAAPGKKPDETVVLAFVGAAPTIRIDWTPKAEGATGLAAMASVQTEQQVWINESIVRTRTALSYAISRAEVRQLTIDVPADQKVVNVFDANVRQWSVGAAEGRQRITVELFEPAKSAQKVTVELEKLSGEKASSAVEVPIVKAVGIGQPQQEGVVVVQVSDGLRAEAVNTRGLVQVDAGDLPTALRGEKWAFAYRYAVPDYQLRLDVERVKPQVAVDSLVEAYLEPERLSLDLAAVYTIEKAGVFRLELDVPAGYDVRDVRGAALAQTGPVDVDSYHLEGKDKTRLVVNLAHKAIGRVALAVQLQKDLAQPELLTPTGKTAEVAVPIPSVAAATAQRATGRLLIYAPESLRVNPGKTAGLRSISFQEALAGMQSLRSQKPAELRPVLAFAYAQEPTALTLAAGRRKPQVTVRQLLVARVEEGVVKYQMTFFYDVLYSGVKSLRIDVPADVAPGLRATTPGVHETTLDPPPADAAKNHVAWSLTGETEFVGSGKIELACERRIEKLAVGKSVELPIPVLRPRNVDRAWGQIVLVKSETIDVAASGEPVSLRPIDPQHDLMSRVPSAARAFEFHDDWSLTMTATRYQLEEVKHTSIERALIRMVVTPAKSVAVQALYRARSAEQRLAVRLPEGAAFDTQPLRINGRPATLESGGQDEYYVPLLGTSPDQAFAMELRYTLNGDGRRLDLPSFPQEPAVVKAYLCAYLPETRVLLGARGPWSEEFAWRFGNQWRWQPLPRTDAAQLVAWATEATPTSGNPAQDFPTDGQLYVYSTLSPASGLEGALRMITLERSWFYGLVFAATILLGLLLLPARIASRVLALSAALVALVLAGVFLTTFSMQILNAALAWAVLIVATTWLMAWIVRHRGSRRVPPTAPPPSPPGATAPRAAQEGGPANG